MWSIQGGDPRESERRTLLFVLPIFQRVPCFLIRLFLYDPHVPHTVPFSRCAFSDLLMHSLLLMPLCHTTGGRRRSHGTRGCMESCNCVNKLYIVQVMRYKSMVTGLRRLMIGCMKCTAVLRKLPQKVFKVVEPNRWTGGLEI